MAASCGFILALLCAAPTIGATTVTAARSTALRPLVQAGAVAYSRLQQRVRIRVVGGGSLTGISLLAHGHADLADSDTPADPALRLREHKIVVLAYAVIVNSRNVVRSLTRAQIRGIFSGRITNWKEVGGADREIIAVNRPESSGSRAVFIDRVMGRSVISEDALAEQSTQRVVNAIAKSIDAISYAALSATGTGAVRRLSIDGIAPTERSILFGRYPFWSFGRIYTRGEFQPEVERFITFLLGQRALQRKQGYIPLGGRD